MVLKFSVGLNNRKLGAVGPDIPTVISVGLNQLERRQMQVLNPSLAVHGTG